MLHKSTLFFFNDTATTEIYTLSLHDALPISVGDAHAQAPSVRKVRVPLHGERPRRGRDEGAHRDRRCGGELRREEDRKSTRLNSSHSQISYAVFCLKKTTLYMRS